MFGYLAKCASCSLNGGSVEVATMVALPLGLVVGLTPWKLEPSPALVYYCVKFGMVLYCHHNMNFQLKIFPLGIFPEVRVPEGTVSTSLPSFVHIQLELFEICAHSPPVELSGK